MNKRQLFVILSTFSKSRALHVECYLRGEEEMKGVEKQSAAAE